ncbi:hypothetical protein [Fluviicola sp.]|uniref:hypothetical protein n=1 Tax=Fluviicola sp. TaxID=1917219 RepID=UPI003D29A3BC
MKTLNYAATSALFVGLTMASCQKEKPSPASEQLKNSDENIETFFEENRATQTLTYSINPQMGGNITTPDGSQLIFEAGAIRNMNGGPISGNVIVRINDIYTRWEMLANNMPSETALSEPTTEGGPLSTGGSYTISIVTAGGNSVTIPNGGVKLTTSGDNTGGFNPGMTLWNGVQSDDQARDKVWTASPTTLQTNDPEYSFPINNPVDMINIDIPEIPLGKSGANHLIPKVYLPANFNADNTEIFVSVDGKNFLLTSLDSYVSSTSGNYWTDNSGYFSEGENGNIIVVSKEGGVLKANITPFTATPNQSITISSIPTISLANLKTAVETLP